MADRSYHCFIGNCQRPGAARGLCKFHHQRASEWVMRHGGELPAANRLRYGLATCLFSGCNRHRYAKGYCRGHWRQQNEGRPMTPLPELPPQACEVDGCGATALPSGRVCPRHHSRRQRGLPDEFAPRTCDECGVAFIPTRSTARFHNSLCAREFSRRMKVFRLSREGYNALLSAQGGVCAICKAESPGVSAKHWYIDHDHACCPGNRSCGGCVRALLCSSCNSGLGFFGDSPVLLRAGAIYLELHRERLATT